MIKKTSSEWIKETTIIVYDPDGWDRENYQFSWFEELITKEEFDKRLMGSTVLSGFKKNL